MRGQTFPTGVEGTVNRGCKRERAVHGRRAASVSVSGFRVHSLTLRVDNLLDERYFDAASRIKEFAANPGRNVALVYRMLF